MTVYGPYINTKNNRKFVTHYENGKHRTQLYSRYVLEIHLGRSLLREEEVDHIDGDSSNDSIDNLQILSKRENIQKRTDDLEQYGEIKSYTCPICDTIFMRDPREVHRKQVEQKRPGPFCSKSCAVTFSWRKNG